MQLSPKGWALAKSRTLALRATLLSERVIDFCLRRVPWADRRVDSFSISVDKLVHTVGRDRVPEEHLVGPLYQPLVLISQVQRSGGTLLSQLFDGHRQCWAHPDELMFGNPVKWELEEAVFNYDRRTLRHLSPQGLRACARKRKYLKAHSRSGKYEPEFRFDYSWFRRRFHEICSSVPDPEARDVAAAYFGAFFEAWETANGQIAPDEKRLITVFTPRVGMLPRSIDVFRHLWPAGVLINVCRDPVDWYASARRHYPREYVDLESSLDLWQSSTRSAIDAVVHSSGARSHLGHLVLFDDLISNTVAVMDELASRLGIENLPSLYNPTVGGHAVQSNSSFRSTHGIDQSTLDRRSDLSDDQIRHIRRASSDLYEQAAEVAILH